MRKSASRSLLGLFKGDRRKNTEPFLSVLFQLHLTLKNPFVQLTTFYMQLIPFQGGVLWKQMQPFLVSPWVCLMLYCHLLVRIVPLSSPNTSTCCWTNPQRITVSCMFVTEVLLLCVLFPSWCLRCSSAGGGIKTRDSRGQRWMYHSRVLSDLLWTGVHYTELT